MIRKEDVLEIIKSKCRYLGDARITSAGDEKTLSSIGGYEMACDDIVEAVEALPEVD